METDRGPSHIRVPFQLRGRTGHPAQAQGRDQLTGALFRLRPGRGSVRVASRWFEGSCEIRSYQLDELLGTKLRALYQRRWGRDLFDLAVALKDRRTDPARIVNAFSAYMDHEGHKVTRAQFERNLALKMRDPQFVADIGPLLAAGYEWDAKAAAAAVSSRLVALLPGKPWKGKKGRE